MQTITNKKVYFFCFLLSILVGSAKAQVGINTTTPNGILDVNSSSSGIVLPRLALTATNIMAPATNPKAGVTNVPVGTTVYNTNITFTGADDVTKGIYSWNGTEWIPQFNRRQYSIYESQIGHRPRSNSVLNLPNLNSSFNAKYTGKYRVFISVNYGAGGAIVPDQGSGGSQSDGNLNIARQSGTFNLSFNGNSYSLPVHAYSTSYDSSVGATNYFAIWQEFNNTFYENFTAGDSVNFSMTFTQNPAPEFVSSGNSGTGRGYVSYDVPCRIEITYIGEQ